MTPFRHDGAVDEAALRELVAWQVESGIDFLVPCGTTGETPTLSRKEWLRVVDITIEIVAGKVPVLAGATSNSTRDAIEKARILSDRRGVDGILTASPYYNKPTQEGQFQHFRAIAQAVKKPLILYNVPSRTGVNIEPATLARLAQTRNIAGVKEASGNISQIAELFNAVPERFLVFSGDDSVTLPVIALGGVGIISVVSNEIPREMSEMTRAALNNDWETARRLHRQFLPLMQANFIESNPIPVKAALAMMGKIREAYRLPLVRMKEDTRAKLQNVMASVGLEIKAAEPSRRRAAVKVEPELTVVATSVVPDAATAAEEPTASETQLATSTTVTAAEEAPSTESPTQAVSAEEQQHMPEQAIGAPQQETVAAVANESSAPEPEVVAQEAVNAVASQPELIAPPPPITFYLYENWQAGPHKTVLHRSTCGACRNGSGRPTGQDQARSRWHGPYSTLEEAREASRGLPSILIRSECKCVKR